MATFTCPDCGHDQFTVDSHGWANHTQVLVHHMTCSQCGRILDVKKSEQ